jgi:chaperonin GroEL (HSP60 family)
LTDSKNIQSGKLQTQGDSLTPQNALEDSAQMSTKKTRETNLALSSVIGEMFEAGYGPKGSKKLMTVIQDELGWAPDLNEMTNDGLTIINGTNFTNPIGQILTETAKAVNNEVGGGIKTVIILIGKLLSKAQKLMDEGLHPRTIIDGFQKACEKAVAIANTETIQFNILDRVSLRKVALTAMSSKISRSSVQHITDLVTKAAEIASEEKQQGKKLDLANIKIEKIENSLLSESYLFNGWVVTFPMSRFEMPERTEDARIAFITRPLEAFSMGQYSKHGDFIKVDVTKKEHIDGFAEKEKEIALKMAQKIAASGANVVISNWNIDDMALEYFSKRGILAFKRVLMPDLTRIQKVTGGKLTDNLDEITSDFLGSSKLVYTQKLYEKEYAFFTGKQESKAATIILRGGSKLLVDEAARGTKDGLSAIREIYKDPRAVYGGGAFEIEIASQLRTYANEIRTKEQLAIKAFAEALEELCALLCKNAGTDPHDMMPELKSRHAAGEKTIGIESYRKALDDMEKLGILEPIRLKLQTLNSAFETSEVILRIDYTLTAKSTGEKKPEEPKTEEEIEKIEQEMVPKIMETTAEGYKQPWEKNL